MAKVNVDRLRLTWWQELLYLLFVMIIPVVIAACEIFTSHNTVFKVTFSSVGCILIVVILVRKFVFHAKVEKWQEKCIMKEHDYEINVGDKDKLRKTWAIYNMLILAYHSIVLILSLVLAWLFITALCDQFVQFKGASALILASALVGIAVRFVIFAAMTRTKEEQDAEAGQE